MMREELMHTYKEWAEENCNDKGDQPTNLTPEEKEGLASLRKRIKDGE